MPPLEPFEPAGFFVLRAPLLPFDEYLAWTRGLASAALPANDLEFAHALEHGAHALTERLAEIVRRPEVREALFLSSPSFEQAATRWAASERAHDDPVVPPLTRYLSRMTSRATPFGLFASVSTGVVGPSTRLALTPLAASVRKTRLDHMVLSALADDTLQRLVKRSQCRLIPSDSLHCAADRLRFVRYRTEGHRRIYQLAAVERTPYLEATLERARDGATLATLSAALVSDDVTEEEARAYVLGLVSRQILIPDGGVPVTGDEPEVAFLSFLGAIPEAAEARDGLDRVHASLARLDEGGIGHPPASYEDARALASALCADVDPAYLFQVDLARPSPDASLGQAVTDEIALCLGVLERLAMQPHVHATALRQFAKLFTERYGDREMPLAEVLDEDLGIGYRTGPETSPILERLSLTSRAGEREEPRASYSAHSIVLGKLWAALASGATEITFEPSELEPLYSETAPRLPDALVVVAALEARSDRALQEGDFRVFLRTAVGPSGASLLGRFCHLDASLRAQVERFLQEEQARRPQEVLAEIVHLPQGRTANVLSRPVLRHYEIPYMGRSGVPPERQILLSDLLVSVRRERVVLRSLRLGCEVIPRLSTAHDFRTSSLALYRFLGALQHQGTSPRPGWDWGILASAPFLPRVRMGRVVLSRARWRLTEEELAPILAARDSDRFRRMAELRTKRGFPERAVCVQGENQLLVDFTNLLGVNAFLDEVRERDTVRLDEVFPAASALCVRSPEGSFFHELLIPFLRRAPAADAGTTGIRGGAASDRPVGAATPDVFVPGSEWLTAKLYCGPAEADRILVRDVGPLVRGLMETGAARRWFFLRYRDPEPHLRVRVQGDPERLRADVLRQLTAMTERLVAEGRLRSLVLDTYERETRRYGGGAAIPHAEEIFFHDSEAVLHVLQALGRDFDTEARFRMALLGVDRLLDDMGCSLEDKLSTMQEARDGFVREFGAEKWFRKRSAAMFRKDRATLDAMLDGDGDREPLALNGGVFGARSERSRHAVAALREAIAAAGVRPLRSVVQSLLHMHVNRMLRSAQREHELVLYDFLVQLYASRRARARHRRAAPAPSTPGVTIG